jgi:hypothetical protein
MVEGKRNEAEVEARGYFDKVWEAYGDIENDREVGDLDKLCEERYNEAVWLHWITGGVNRKGRMTLEEVRGQKAEECDGVPGEGYPETAVANPIKSNSTYNFTTVLPEGRDLFLPRGPLRPASRRRFAFGGGSEGYQKNDQAALRRCLDRQGLGEEGAGASDRGQ